MSNVIQSFLQEEILIMSCYDISGKQLLISGIQEAMPHAEDGIQELMTRCVGKLQKLSEPEFTELRAYLEDPKVF